jgi:cytochrome c peroxidase
MHAFKTPGLRNTLYRAPYMHNGKTSSIKGVIFHYISGGIKRPSLSEKMRPLDLSEQDISDLMAFLKTLTAEQQDLALPTLPN